MRRQRPNDRGQKPETRGRSPEVRKQKPEDGKKSATEVRPLAAGLWPLVSDILGPGVQLLTHDTNGLAALNKPAGILAHPNTPGDAPRSLLQARYHPDGEYYEWTKQKTEDASQPKSGLFRPLASGLSDSRETAPPPHRLWLLNRLDSGTSGVILVCADETLAREIRALFQRKQIHKIYHALVFGRPSQARQVWRDRLAVQKKGGHIRTGTGGNLPAETHMTVLRQQRDGPPPLALLELTPRTGRSHQLRVQCAQRHLPIVGDATYGNFAANRAFGKQHAIKRLCLHSHATSFDYEWRGRTHTFRATAPTPSEFHHHLFT